MNSKFEILESGIRQFSSKKIAIVGDIGLDEYVIGKVKRISPEAPVPVVEVEREDKKLGLSSNIAANVCQLGAKATLISVVGDDQAGKDLRQLLSQIGCQVDGLIADNQRPTTRKLRVMAGPHHVVRVDYERKQYLSSDVENRIIEQVEDIIPQVDGVILEDYAKGVLTQKIIQSVVKTAKKFNKFVSLDPHRSTPVSHYQGIDFMTPNTDEALELSGYKGDELRPPSDTLAEVGADLLEKTHARGVIITRGAQGMSIFTQNGKKHGEHVPTFARQVFDVTGAGDTVISAFALSQAVGLSIYDSCIISNHAAGIVVGKLGCATTTPAELISSLKGSPQ